jgi:anti-sigma factor RsiW
MNGRRDAGVSEEELHAYVDGQLPEDRVAAVQAYLAAHPDAASRVAAWRWQATKIRERFDPVLDEPVPERLRVETVLSQKRAGWPRIAAVAAIAFVLGAGIGWFGRDRSELGRNTDAARALADAAILAHRIYVPDMRHPIEVRADEDHLVPWLSKRVGSPLKAPDLQAEGLKLLGGRLLAGPNGPTALFMYQGASGERVTLTTARAPGEGETQFQWRAEDKICAVAWFERGLAFVVAGPAQRDRIDRVAKRVYDAYEIADGAPEGGRRSAP